MNLSDFESEAWNYTGYQDAGAQQDWLRQKIRDAANLCLEKLATVVPDQLALTRETTLALVSGTGSYTLNDWAIRAASFYTIDVTAHKVNNHKARNADRTGMRSSALATTSLGPYDCVWLPESSTAYRSGASGATGATAANNSLTVTVGGSPGFNGTEVGRMLKLNGEYADYMVMAASGNTITVDRPIYARLTKTGTGVTGIGPNYSGVKWEIGPKKRSRIQFLPAPITSISLPYRYLFMPRKLLWPDDEPEIRDEYHDLILKGIIKELGVFQENLDQYQAYSQEWNDAMKRWTTEDRGDQDSEDSVNWESPQNHASDNLLPGVNPPRGWVG